MAVLELRESIEDSSDIGECQRYLTETQDQVNLAIEKIAAGFAKRDLVLIKHEIDKLKFLYSVLEAAQSKVDSEHNGWTPGLE